MIPQTLRLGSYQYVITQQQLLDGQGQPCTLRHQSLQVLHALAAQANTVVPKDELFRKVWKEVYVTDDSLVQCVADIRRALQDDKHEILKTVPRRGYVLVAYECADAPVSCLPEDVLPFLGRTQELQDLQDMLINPACRLISIVGLGGVGKSRLAKAIARQITLQFAQGICWVELAAVQTSEGDREGQVNVLRGVGIAKAMLNDLTLAWQFMVVAEDMAEHLKIPLLADNQPLLEASKQRIQRELNPGLLALHRNLGRAGGLKNLSDKMLGAF